VRRTRPRVPERAPLEARRDADLDADPAPLPEPEPEPEPEPILLHTRAAPGAPRVEVLPAPSGPATREEDEERRSPMSMPADLAGQDPRSFGPAPFPPRPSVRELDDPDLPAEPSWVERPDAAPPRSAATPAVWATPPQPSGPSVRVESAAAPPSPADRPWVQSSTVPGGEAARGEPRRPAGRRPSPMLVTALLTGWLVAIALLVP
jgi:hypothetical protein